MHDKNLGISEYIDVYGSVLESRQREIMDMYYNDDYSLSEISEITGITRQAVCESIKKSTARLDSLESKLHIIKRTKEFEKKRDIIKQIVNSDERFAELRGIISELTF